MRPMSPLRLIPEELALWGDGAFGSDRGVNTGGVDGGSGAAGASTGKEWRGSYSGHAYLGGDSRHRRFAWHRWGRALVKQCFSPRALGGAHLDLVECRPCLKLPGDATPNDAVSAPGSLGAVDRGAVELVLLGYPSALSPSTS
jgi:hypothetical protein